ncbi:hypothetical protein EV359DRAFT_69185, partial [Lentinula novae-zelandiae]
PAVSEDKANPPMTTSRTTTETTNTVGSIPITGGTDPQPSDPTCPSTLSASDKERELEKQMERNQERLQKLKEKRKAKEAARKKAEEEAARRAAEKEQERQEVAARARRSEEEAAEKRRRMAARNRRGPSLGEVTASACQVKVEIPLVIRKGKGHLRTEAVGGDPDDSNDSDDDDDDEDEWAPCERYQAQRIPCQMHTGKRSSLICKPCHDSKVQCSYSGWPPTVKREGGVQPTGKHLAVLESQMAQLLTDNRQFREGQAEKIAP